jgi:hypothetical protein
VGIHIPKAFGIAHPTFHAGWQETASQFLDFYFYLLGNTSIICIFAIAIRKGGVVHQTV